MSYARFSDGDVYVLATCNDDDLTCLACSLRGGPGHSFGGTLKQMLQHLKQHIRAGDVVPGHCLERIRREIKEERK